MGIVVATSLCLVSLQFSTSELDAAQFLRLMESLNSEVHDFDVICEGRIFTIDDDSKKGQLYQTFQSEYVYRRDGAVYWDIYRKPTHNGGSFKRLTHAVLSGFHTELTRVPDLFGARGSVTKKKGSASSVAYDGSPGRFIFLYYWDRFLSYPDHFRFESEGWEDIDGHRCLRVAINEAPQRTTPGAPLSRFWIDFERNGHALKREFFVKDALWLRVDNVRLAKFTLPSGERTWFPVHAEVETFPIRNLTTAHFREVCDLVQGSVLFNQKLSDSRFNVDWKGGVNRSERLAAAAKEFATIPRKEPDRASRIDPKGVQEDLDRRLEAADRQAKQLDASPPSNRTWSMSTLIQLGLGLGGFVSLIVAHLIYRRAL